MVAAVPTTGTIPALPPYQPGALPMVGTEYFEIVNTASASTAASYRMLCLDLVGKAPSAMGSQVPTSNDLVSIFQKTTGLYFSSTIGNLGIPSGNIPVGGTAGQILEKNSATNYDVSWSNLSGLLTASTAITLSGSTTVAISVTPQSIGSTQLGTFAVQSNNIATNAVGNVQLRQGSPLSVIGVAGNTTTNVGDIVASAGAQLLQSNPAGTGLLFGGLSTALLPGPFQISSFTANGVVYGNGTSPLGATAAGTAGMFLQANGLLTAPGFALVNVGAATNITGVLNVINGGLGTSNPALNGVVYGNGTTSPIGVTPPGTTAWPLVANGTLLAPAFAVLSVPGGGTNTTTLIANGVMFGNGTSTVGITPAGTIAFPLVANGTLAAPAFALLTVPGGGSGTGTLTINGIVYGNGTSAVGVTPAAGTALPLVGNGPSAAPGFAVLTVPGGGLGTSLLATNALLLGNGANTIAVIAAATAGLFLGANGPGSAPTYQAVPGASISTLTMTGGLSVLGLGTSGGAFTTGAATLTNVRLVSAKATSFTFANSDLASLVTFSNASLGTATIPQASGTVGNAFANGWFVDIQNVATGSLILAPQTSLINAGAIFTVFKNQGLRIISDGTNYQIQGGGALAVSLNNTAQTFSGGLRLVPFNLGTAAVGSTVVLDSGSGPIQRLINNGAFTMSPPTSDGELDLLVTNAATAGAITFAAGWNVGSNTGDSYTTTSTNKFILMVRTINALPTYAWKALQ